MYTQPQHNSATVGIDNVSELSSGEHRSAYEPKVHVRSMQIQGVVCPAITQCTPTRGKSSIWGGFNCECLMIAKCDLLFSTQLHLHAQTLH